MNDENCIFTGESLTRRTQTTTHRPLRPHLTPTASGLCIRHFPPRSRLWCTSAFVTWTTPGQRSSCTSKMAGNSLCRTPKLQIRPTTTKERGSGSSRVTEPWRTKGNETGSHQQHQNMINSLLVKTISPGCFMQLRLPPAPPLQQPRPQLPMYIRTTTTTTSNCPGGWTLLT